MTNVIELARQAEGIAHTASYSPGMLAFIERFSTLVRNAALEDAAKICDAEQAKNEEKGQWLWEAKKSAAAIRNMKDNT